MSHKLHFNKLGSLKNAQLMQNEVFYKEFLLA